MRWRNVGMSFSSCSVSNRFLNYSWKSVFVGLIYVVSTLINSLLTRVMIVTSHIFAGCSQLSVFFTPFRLFGVHILSAYFWNVVCMILYFLVVSYSSKLSPHVFIPSPNIFEFVRFPITIPSLSCLGFLIYYTFRCKSCLCLLLNIMLLGNICELSSVCSSKAIHVHIQQLWGWWCLLLFYSRSVYLFIEKAYSCSSLLLNEIVGSRFVR